MIVYVLGIVKKNKGVDMEYGPVAFSYEKPVYYKMNTILYILNHKVMT